jgi:nucleoid-associated protein YgaU
LLSKPRNISPGQKLEIPPLEQSAPTAK